MAKIAIQLSDLETAVLNAQTKELMTTPPNPAAVTVVSDDTVLPAGGESATGTLKNDTYFPININIPQQPSPNSTSTKTPLTEDQRRQRAIMFGIIALVALIVLIFFISRKK